MAETIYINSLSGKQGKYGIRLSGKVEKIIEELNKHVNDKGYINLEVLPKREPDKYGNTHYVKLDTWEPKKPEVNTDWVKDSNAAGHGDAPAEKKTTDRNGIVTEDDNSLPF